MVKKKRGKEGVLTRTHCIVYIRNKMYIYYVAALIYDLLCECNYYVL